MIKSLKLPLLLLTGLLALASTPARAENSYQTIFPSAARTVATADESAEFTNSNWRGMRLFLNITVEVGTSTLDVKVQCKDTTSGTWFDLPGASLDQKSAITGDDILTIYPGIAETANESVSDALGRTYRVVAAVGGTGFTFSVGVHLLD